MTDWQLEPVLKAIQCELENLPSEITQEAKKRIACLAAAWGEIFIQNGGRWVWNDSVQRVLIKIYDRNWGSERSVSSPLDLIYSSVINDHLESVCLAIRNNLKGVKKI